jgi:purine-binding chemotaxis protein CheW
MAALATAAAGVRRVVCFRVHHQEYGADIGHVKETLTLRPITRVFLTPPWLAGIINLRGDVVAVMDLALLLGMTPTQPGADSRIVILRSQGRVAGVLVDCMAELRTLDPAALQAPPATVPAEVARFLAGIATVEDGKPLRVLAVDELVCADLVCGPRARGAVPV